MNLREVRDDILKDWLLFREEDIASLTCAEDKKHFIYIDEITEEILKHIPEDYHDFVKRQLNKLDDNFMDYIGYWNEKYYRNGFCDGVELISSCLNR